MGLPASLPFATASLGSTNNLLTLHQIRGQSPAHRVLLTLTSLLLLCNFRARESIISLCKVLACALRELKGVPLAPVLRLVRLWVSRVEPPGEEPSQVVLHPEDGEKLKEQATFLSSRSHPEGHSPNPWGKALTILDSFQPLVGPYYGR